MTTHRILDERGDVVITRDFEAADAAGEWFTNAIADDEQGWRMEVDDHGHWRLFEDSERNPE